MKYKIVRSTGSGVWFGEIESRDGQEVIMTNARRIWYWAGAATLSQLAMEGTKSKTKCKFPCPVNRVTILDAVEILDVTDAASKSIMEVPIWSM